MPFTCPDDGAQLVVETFHGVSLEVCPTCDGIWFRQDQLNNLLSSDSRVLEELGRLPFPTTNRGPVGTSSLRCPEDGATLQQYHYLYSTPIILEQCPTCGGFFVKHADLQRMQRALDQSKGLGTKLEQDTALGGLEEAQHYQYLDRQSQLTTFFNFLDYHANGAWGLL